MKNTDFLSSPNEDNDDLDDPQIRKAGSTDTSDKGSSRGGQIA